MRRRPGAENGTDHVEIFEILDDSTAPGGLTAPLRPARQSRDVLLAGVGVCLLAAIWLSAGDQRSQLSGLGRTASSSQRSAPVLSSYAAIDETGSRCVTSTGTTVVVSEQIVNTSGDALMLQRVQAVLPMGGLTVLGVTGGACDLPASGVALPGLTVPGLARLWVVATLQIMALCPAPYPVQFRVAYTQHGVKQAVMLTGFVDLGGVSFPGCLPGRLQQPLAARG
ncbi:MAG: hypothetical protein ACR2KJ_05005 [Jatrophihabitans sp.]